MQVGIYTLNTRKEHREMSIGLQDQIHIAWHFERHKDHFVTKQFSQQEGIDYTKIFAPIANINSV